MNQLVDVSMTWWLWVEPQLSSLPRAHCNRLQSQIIDVLVVVTNISSAAHRNLSLYGGTLVHIDQ